MARSLAEVGGSSARAAAFTDLAERHLDSSYRLARAILGDSSEAEDATHDALIQAWRHWDQLRDHSRFEQWFDRIVVNTCRNRLRHVSKLKVVDISTELVAVGDNSSSGDDSVRSVADRDQIGAALARLSADHRIVVALRYFGDLSLEEIAARVGIPVGTVTSRLHYALKQLRSELSND